MIWLGGSTVAGVRVWLAAAVAGDLDKSSVGDRFISPATLFFA